MKPGDHPDFFRLPPPEGRSRESSIRLDAEGNFWHDGERVTHLGMQRAFASWIDRHPDDGRYILNNGYDWSYFTVDEVPFFVRAVRVEPHAVTLLLSDDEREALDAETLGADARGRLHVSVKSRRFEARFSSQAQAALAPLLREGASGALELEIAGRRYAIAERA
jgi:uncharacterized protein